MADRSDVLDLDRLRFLVKQGRPEAAIPVARGAYDAAVETGDESLVGRAVSNLGTIFAVAGRGQEAVTVLTQTLAQSSDPYVSFRLSQSLALHYGLLEVPDLVNHERYGRLAYDFAERSGNTSARIGASHEMGLVMTNRNDHPLACELFVESYQLAGSDPNPRHSPALAALGYCLAQSGDLYEGIRALSHSVGLAQSLDAPIYEVLPRIFLANCMLELRRPRDAEFQLRSALQLERNLMRAVSEVPKILRLLGDSLKMQRRYREASAAFRELQLRFYPEQEGLAEILMEADARRNVNLFI